MTARTFLLSSLLSVLFLGAAYVVFVFRFVLLDQPLPMVYNHYLLEASTSSRGKVVIESGSNGLHSLVVEQLADRLDRPVLVVSDSAGYPLRYKYHRLVRLLAPGDILVLPLEWDYYFRGEGLADAFLQRIADERRTLAFYYSGLPLLEKLRFILFKYPLRHALEAWFTEHKQDPGNRWALRRLDKFQERFAAGDNRAYGAVELDDPGGMHFMARAAESCDHYLFWRDASFPATVSETFLENLALLEQLRAVGVAVYFTWPVVVDSAGSTCYRQPEVSAKLDGLAREIAELVESRGMPFLGHYRDSQYPAECFLNTFYHIRYSCAPAHTDYLADLLLGAGVEAGESGRWRADFSAAVWRGFSATRAALEVH